MMRVKAHKENLYTLASTSNLILINVKQDHLETKPFVIIVLQAMKILFNLYTQNINSTSTFSADYYIIR